MIVVYSPKLDNLVILQQELDDQVTGHSNAAMIRALENLWSETSMIEADDFIFLGWL